MNAYVAWRLDKGIGAYATLFKRMVGKYPSQASEVWNEFAGEGPIVGPSKIDDRISTVEYIDVDGRRRVD